MNGCGSASVEHCIQLQRFNNEEKYYLITYQSLIKCMLRAERYLLTGKHSADTQTT